MKKTNKILAGLCAAITCMTAGTAVLPQYAAVPAAAETISNPFIWSDVPDNDVIRVGDTYYMVSTTMYFSPGAPIMKSKDLVSWEICSYVYDTLAQGDVQTLSNGKHDYAHGQWAASLRYHDGVFYVFFGSYGTGKSYIFKTRDPEKSNWDRVELNGMYHDASILFDDDGRNYLVYGGGGEIKIKEFNSEMTDFKWGGVDKTLFKTGLSGLAGEGSHIQKIGDYYYVFIIAWPSGSGRIELCYRCKELTGNYEGKTVLNSGLGTYGSGVAQGGIVDTPDGKWYGVLFQDHGGVGRIPVLVPVTWQDNWPVMGVNGKAPLTIDIDTAYTGAALAKDDDFSDSTLALEWQWNHNPVNSAWSLSDRPGWLRLTNSHTTDKGLLFARNTLTMRTEGPKCSGSIKLDASGMKPGDRAGLAAFQFKYGCVGIMVDDWGGKKIYYANNGGYGGDKNVTDSRDNIVKQVDLNGDVAYFKVDFTFNNVNADGSASNNIDKVKFYYSLDGSDWTQIGEELGMDYNLKLFTGYRSALYSYATKEKGGYADFDYFDYERAEWNVPQVIETDKDGYWFHYTFEKGSEGFTSRGSETVAASSDQAYESNQGLAVTNRQAAWNGAAHSLSTSVCHPGEAYSFSAVAKSAGDAAETFHFTLSYRGADGEVHYDKIATETAAPGEWVQLANQNYLIPADATGMQIYVETDKGSESFYIDEVIGAPAGTEIAGPGGGLAPLLGDTDCDGTVNAKDLTAAKRAVSSGAFASVQAQRNTDMNGDGTVDAADILLLRDYLLG